MDCGGTDTTSELFFKSSSVHLWKAKLPFQRQLCLSCERAMQRFCFDKWYNIGLETNTMLFKKLIQFIIFKKVNNLTFYPFTIWCSDTLFSPFIAIKHQLQCHPHVCFPKPSKQKASHSEIPGVTTISYKSDFSSHSENQSAGRCWTLNVTVESVVPSFRPSAAQPTRSPDHRSDKAFVLSSTLIESSVHPNSFTCMDFRFRKM